MRCKNTKIERHKNTKRQGEKEKKWVERKKERKKERKNFFLKRHGELKTKVQKYSKIITQRDRVYRPKSSNIIQRGLETIWQKTQLKHIIIWN